MAQLNAEMARKVDEAESGGTLVPEGIYKVELAQDVEVREGDKGPYWAWTFQVPEGEEFAGRKFYTNTSLSEAAFFRLKEVFAAFGVPTTTNTEDLVKRRVRVHVVQRTIQKGTRAGELRNEIDALLTLDGPTGPDEVKADAKTGSAKGGSSDEPLF